MRYRERSGRSGAGGAVPGEGRVLQLEGESTGAGGEVPGGGEDRGFQDLGRIRGGEDYYQEGKSTGEGGYRDGGFQDRGGDPGSSGIPEARISADGDGRPGACGGVTPPVTPVVTPPVTLTAPAGGTAPPRAVLRPRAKLTAAGPGESKPSFVHAALDTLWGWVVFSEAISVRSAAGHTCQRRWFPGILA